MRSVNTCRSIDWAASGGIALPAPLRRARSHQPSGRTSSRTRTFWRVGHTGMNARASSCANDLISSTCSIRVSTQAFERIGRIVRKAKQLKFFVFNMQQWCESHPLRHPYSVEGPLPSNSPTRALARRFVGSLRSRGSLALLVRADAIRLSKSQVTDGRVFVRTAKTGQPGERKRHGPDTGATTKRPVGSQI